MAGVISISSISYAMNQDEVVEVTQTKQEPIGAIMIFINDVSDDAVTLSRWYKGKVCSKFYCS